MRCFDVIYVSYEHDERFLLDRLVAVEVASVPEAGPGEEVDPSAAERARARVRSYADRLLLVRGSGSSTNVKVIRELVAEHAERGSVLFLDYIQKVPNGPEFIPEPEHMARVAGGLKDLALTFDIPVVAVAAATHSGLVAPRVRLHHLRGAEAIAYEADVVMMLNEKLSAVSEAHRSYDLVRERTFRDYVIFSLEKNRRGLNFVDLEFRKDFQHARFDPAGNFVADRLVDDVLGVH